MTKALYLRATSETEIRYRDGTLQRDYSLMATIGYNRVTSKTSVSELPDQVDTKLLPTSTSSIKTETTNTLQQVPCLETSLTPPLQTGT
jgi:hypothetical protein